MRTTAATGTNAARRVLAVMAVALGVAIGCTPGTTPLPGPGGGGASGPSAGCAVGTDRGGIDVGSSKRQSLVVSVDGVNRRSFLQLPPGYDATVAAPVLVSLHPFVLDNDKWEQYSGLADAAAARGYVVVSPLGSDPGPRWAVPGGLETGADDLGFISTLLDTLAGRLCVEQGRAFAAGFSAGAAMAEALGCVFPDRFAAIAGSGGTNLTSLCPAAPGVDTMVLHGSADPIAPTTGSYTPFATPLGLHVDAVVASAAARNGCDATPTQEAITASVLVDRYAGCDGTSRVEYWRMLGAGHTWAGPKPPLVAELGGVVVGATDASISATERVLDFFDATEL